METGQQGNAASEYIQHHLINATQKEVPQSFIVDFSYLNLDSLFVSIVLGAVICFILWRAANKSTSGVPSRFLAAVEILVEFVENLSKDIIHNADSRKLVSPLALTLFIWILVMNAMDFLPVDLLPWVWQGITGDHHAYLRVVPTADVNVPLALALGVLLTCFYYSIKIKGIGGWFHELFTAPFGSHWSLAIPNFLLNMVEYISKTVSHGLRLFGNMYAGEMVFMLIALLGGAWMAGGSLSFVDPILMLLHILSGAVWAIFHILIVTLQAFIFMILALVYIGQAHDSH